MLTFYPSRIPDPGVKKAPDPGSGSATLDNPFTHYLIYRLFHPSPVHLLTSSIGTSTYHLLLYSNNELHFFPFYSQRPTPSSDSIACLPTLPVQLLNEFLLIFIFPKSIYFIHSLFYQLPCMQRPPPPHYWR